ncbi:uncharacterized protein ACBR49_013354 isoform 1-T1 [Aulostomus maculatus]
MVKASLVSSGEVVNWVFIIWLFSASTFAVSGKFLVQTPPRVVARCGDNVTLTCDVTSTEELGITLFSWLGPNNTCNYEVKRDGPDFKCDSARGSLNHSLKLSLINVTPGHQGKFICKLRSKLGVNHNSTNVTVQDCLGRNGSSINKSTAECWFSGVYPRGEVHWFQEKVDITASARLQVDQVAGGWYNIKSTIDVKEGSHFYKCSLWIPDNEKYLSTQQLTMVKEQKASGAVIALQWFCLLLEIMTLIFVM